MLQMTEVKETLQESIAIDKYIPLDVKWIKDTSELEETLYWRAGNFEDSLFEIGVSEADGSVSSLTLTLMNKENVYVENYYEIPTKVTDGLPLLDQNEIVSEGFFDKTNNLKVEISTRHLRVFFDANHQVTSQLENGRIRFGLTENDRLVMIELTGIKEEEYKKLMVTMSL